MVVVRLQPTPGTTRSDTNSDAHRDRPNEFGPTGVGVRMNSDPQEEQTMAHYVITGGTGFVGQALCRRLAARGVALTVLTRDPARAARCLPPGTRTVTRLADVPADEPVDCGDQPGGRADRRGALERGAQAPAGGQPHRAHAGAGALDGAGLAAARRVDQRIGDRLLRRPGRCAGHRGQRAAPRVHARTVRRVGAGRVRGARARHPHRGAAHRPRGRLPAAGFSRACCRRFASVSAAPSAAGGNG